MEMIVSNEQSAARWQSKFKVQRHRAEPSRALLWPPKPKGVNLESGGRGLAARLGRLSLPHLAGLEWSASDAHSGEHCACSEKEKSGRRIAGAISPPLPASLRSWPSRPGFGLPKRGSCVHVRGERSLAGARDARWRRARPAEPRASRASRRRSATAPGPGARAQAASESMFV